MRVAAMLQEVAADLEGEEFTAAVRRVYDTILTVGEDATTPGDLAVITAAGDDLRAMPNATLTVAGVYAVRLAFAS